MYADQAIEDFSLDDDLARIDDLLPLWQRFGPEQAEERRAAACRQFLELAAEGATDSAPPSAIERLLAVNLVVVQAAALDCLQRDSRDYGQKACLRQGARLMDLCLRLARTLAREQAERRREAAQAEAAAQAPTAPATETASPIEAEPPVKRSGLSRGPRDSAARPGTPPQPAGPTPPVRGGPPGRDPPRAP